VIVTSGTGISPWTKNAHTVEPVRGTTSVKRFWRDGLKLNSRLLLLLNQVAMAVEVNVFEVNEETLFDL
jgi:hypothetical protein